MSDNGKFDRDMFIMAQKLAQVTVRMGLARQAGDEKEYRRLEKELEKLRKQGGEG